MTGSKGTPADLRNAGYTVAAVSAFFDRHRRRHLLNYP